jgi:hypothetical protein
MKVDYIIIKMSEHHKSFTTIDLAHVCMCLHSKLGLEIPRQVSDLRSFFRLWRNRFEWDGINIETTQPFSRQLLDAAWIVSTLGYKGDRNTIDNIIETSLSNSKIHESSLFA